MVSEHLGRASDPIVYIDVSEVGVGSLEDLKDGIRRLVETLEPREPQLIAYGFHLDEDAGEMTVTAVHPDSASLELHLEIGSEEFRKLAGMITLRQIRVYGRISDRARAMLEQKLSLLGGDRLVVTERFAGFDHLPAPGFDHSR
jgi:hypothetical protein